MTQSGGAGWPVVVPRVWAVGPGDPPVVGPYRVEGVLGEGGTGRVFLGRTPAGGAVAVKVLHREFAADGEFRKRFEHEVALARAVQGLYTVPVVGADVWAERPWLATAYVPGASLQYVVGEFGPLDVGTAVRLTAAVAEALQSLHAAGVVHRDLKPSNVLLTADGPRVIDFSIARAADATSVTSTGTLTGTPAFLAPEYIRGEEVTGAADVFALGVLAAFAATGRLAFGGGHAHAVTYRIMEQEPELDGCPEPLRDVVLACVAKDPAQRPSPAGVIERCQAAMSDLPTTASGTAAAPAPSAELAPPPPLAPAQAPVPPPAPVQAQAPLPAPAPPEAPVFPQAPAPAPQAYAPTAPVAQPSASPRQHTRRNVLIAAGAVGVVGLGVAIPLLRSGNDDGSPPSAPGRSEPSGDGPFRLAGTLEDPRQSVNSGLHLPAFSPDGRLLATAALERVLLWDVASREQRGELSGHTDFVFGVAFSPDGALLATAGHDLTARLWDVARGEQRAALSGHTDRLTDVAFSPDGRLLATSSEDHTVRLWDVAGGKEHAVLAIHNADVRAVSFHPDGQLLASASSDQSVVLWNVADGRPINVLTGHVGAVTDVAFSPDGSMVAASDAGGPKGKVIFWDTAVVGQQIAVLEDFEESISSVAFSPDGRLLATAAERLVVWDAVTGDRQAAIDAHDDLGVRYAVFSPTGMLASSGWDAKVRLWEKA